MFYFHYPPLHTNNTSIISPYLKNECKNAKKSVIYIYIYRSKYNNSKFSLAIALPFLNGF